MLASNTFNFLIPPSAAQSISLQREILQWYLGKGLKQAWGGVGRHLVNWGGLRVE